MYYEELATAYDRIENTSGTLDKIDILADIFKRADKTHTAKIVALTTGKLHPDWKGEPELGIAEKMAIQAVAASALVSESEIERLLQKVGDIGTVAEKLLAESAQSTLFAEELTIEYVYDKLNEIANATGAGSAKQKISLLSHLLNNASPLEARYILRTVTGTLRLGIGDMGILDALALTFTGTRDTRPIIEKAYNLCSDLGRVAQTLAESGLDEIKKIHVEVGIPIRMMAAKRLSSAQEIMEKVGGKCIVEYKYDGERMQIHKKGNEVIIYSRRQERITNQYPDVVQLVLEHMKAEVCVVEAECVAIDPETGKMRPFQELMRRRRKTEIEATMAEVPVALFFFDILYLDGEDTTENPMLERRALLEKIIEETDRVHLTVGEVTDDPNRLEEIFETAISTGHEGVIAKAIHSEAVYQAGSRSWLWIKLKASYKEGMTDSVDLVIVGAFHGRGKRTGVYGTILAAAYDDMNDTFPTVCKIGTGFTDEILEEMKKRLEEHILERKDPSVISDMEADVWFQPVEVIEVLGDEITISPVHPAGRGRIPGHEGGLAIRFPRFTGRWRDDKEPTQATTVEDLIDMFLGQRSRS